MFKRIRASRFLAGLVDSGAGRPVRDDDGGLHLRQVERRAERIADAAGPVDAVRHGKDESSVPDLYDSVRPSVVRITSISTTRRRSARSRAEGLGSGIILDTDGNILTNYHVVEGAQQLEVTLGDESSASARGRRHRPGGRPGGDQGRLPVRRHAFAGHARRLRPDPRRRVGHRHRQPVRPRRHGDGRDRQRPRPDAGRAAEPPAARAHPDRRGDQPGQLRRAARRTSTARSSASTRPSRTRPARTRSPASATPSRSTSAKQELSQLLAGKTVVHARLGVSGQTITREPGQGAEPDGERGSVRRAGRRERAGGRARASRGRRAPDRTRWRRLPAAT